MTKTSEITVLITKQAVENGDIYNWISSLRTKVHKKNKNSNRQLVREKPLRAFWE